MRAFDPDTRLTVLASAVSVVSTMPAFLVGASGALIRPDIPITDAALGTAISVFFAAAALFSVRGGSLAEWIGGGRALAISAGTSGLALTGLGVMRSSQVWLFVFLAVAGASNGLAQPAANLALAGTTPDDRQAFRFGVKQASMPLATFLAGISIPIVGSTFGWRWSFLVSALSAGGLTAFMLARPLPMLGKGDTPVVNGRGRTVSGPLVALALAGCLGASAATAIPSFLPQTAINAGFSVNGAGMIMAGGSIASIAARLSSGWLTPQGHSAVRIVMSMLALGAVGYMALSLTGSDFLVIGSALAFAFGWGWPGLFHFAVVTLHPRASGTASGIGQSATALGAASGPVLFGTIASVGGYRVAWTVAAVAACAASAAMWSAQHLLKGEVSAVGHDR